MRTAFLPSAVSPANHLLMEQVAGAMPATAATASPMAPQAARALKVAPLPFKRVITCSQHLWAAVGVPFSVVAARDPPATATWAVDDEIVTLAGMVRKGGTAAQILTAWARDLIDQNTNEVWRDKSRTCSEGQSLLRWPASARRINDGREWPCSSHALGQ